MLSATLSAQVVANDDVFSLSLAGAVTPQEAGLVIQNDLVDGNPAWWSAISVTQVSSSHPGVYLSASNLYTLRVSPDVPEGIYTLTYSLCMPNMPGSCDTATATVKICNTPIPSPAVTALNQVSCAASGSVALAGLPAGEWTIRCQRQWYEDIVFTGTGATTTLSLPPGNFSIRAYDASGCGSAPVTAVLTESDMAQSIASSMTATYQDYNEDGIVSPGDVIFYNFLWTNDGSCPLADVRIENEQFGDSVTVFGSPLAELGPGVTHDSITAVYTLGQNDITAGSVTLWFAARGTFPNGVETYYSKLFANVPLGISDGFKIKAFKDLNGNGTMDAGETFVDNATFTYQIDGGEAQTVYQYNDSEYLVYETNPAHTYTVTFQQDGPSFLTNQYTVSPAQFSFNVPAGSGITEYRFALGSGPVIDGGILLSGTTPRPGFELHNYIHVGSNQLAPEGLITYTKDPSVTILAVEPPGAIMTPTGFLFSIADVGPWQTISVLLQVPTIPTVNLGDVLQSQATLAIVGETADLSNNVSDWAATVVGSYDPNDKSEHHGGKVAIDDFGADDYLTYTIRFENTGTAEARNIRIDDLLDAQLDPATAQLVVASHPCTMQREGNLLSWKFVGIDLPPSNDVPESMAGHGFVTFRVKPLAGFAAGDVIPNAASIYFDFNPAIVTEICNTQFVETLSVTPVAETRVRMYPNPVADRLTIECEAEVVSVTVRDLTGKTLLQTDGKSVDMRSLSTGMYLVEVMGDGIRQTAKVVKR